MIEAEKIKPVVRFSELAPGEEELGITGYGLIEQLSGAKDVFSSTRIKGSAREQRFRLGEKIERGKIVSRRFVNLRFFTGSDVGPELSGNGGGDFALDREDVV